MIRFLFPSCSVCFGVSDSPMVKGVFLGVLVLMAVIVGVLVAIASTAFRWARRAREIENTRP